MNNNLDFNQLQQLLFLINQSGGMGLSPFLPPVDNSNINFNSFNNFNVQDMMMRNFQYQNMIDPRIQLQMAFTQNANKKEEINIPPKKEEKILEQNNFSLSSPVVADKVMLSNLIVEKKEEKKIRKTSIVNEAENKSTEQSTPAIPEKKIEMDSDGITNDQRRQKFQIQTDKIEIPDLKLKYFKCKHCEKIFPKESNLNDHMRTHTGEKPFKCDFENCGKSFSQLGNLKKHETIHYGEKAFFCEYPDCGKGFSALYNLKIHQRSHSGEKPYRCTLGGCTREFYDKGNLKYHEKTSHSYDLKMHPFSCDHVGCNMKFKTKKQKLIHHQNMEPECKHEKNQTIELISQFKKFLFFMIEKFNIPKETLEADENYIKLKKDYSDLEKNLIDQDFLFFTAGESFEDIPK